jgi:hypothetical protein
VAPTAKAVRELVASIAAFVVVVALAICQTTSVEPTKLYVSVTAPTVRLLTRPSAS